MLDVTKASNRRATFTVAVCLLGAVSAALLGRAFRVAIAWSPLIDGGEDVTLGPHPATVFAKWALLVAAAMAIVWAVAAKWGPRAQARVRTGVVSGAVVGLIAGAGLLWLAHPLGYGNGGWTLAELSTSATAAIGPLSPGLDPLAQLIGLRAITLVGPAIAWGVYGAVLGLTRHAWTLRRVQSPERPA
jgi:hypothetical protein